MKPFGRNLLPDSYFNPITRDLLVIIMTGLVAAVALATFGMMILSRF